MPPHERALRVFYFMEIWKPIKNYEGKYDVSNYGNVKSYPKKTTSKTIIMKQAKSKQGYLSVELCFNGLNTRILIHRLVAMAFIPNPDNKPCVNHKDGDKSNNHIDNLEWVTYSENEKHSYIKLSKKPNKTGLGKFGKLNGNSKAVHQFDLNGNLIKTFDSANCAVRHLKSIGFLTANPSPIKHVVYKRMKTAYGFKWSYNINEYSNLTNG